MKTLKTISLSVVLLSSVLLASAQKSASNIDKITAAYFSVKDALAAGNAAGAQNNAKQLFAALSLQPDKGLNAGQQKALNTYLDKLKFDSRHISETNAIDHQREHFASLSKNMYEVLKSVKTNTKPIYMQYCPMKKAYWLSESAQIKNPYYNDKMMTTCGSTKATLAAVK